MELFYGYTWILSLNLIWKELNMLFLECEIEYTGESVIIEKEEKEREKESEEEWRKKTNFEAGGHRSQWPDPVSPGQIQNTPRPFIK